MDMYPKYISPFGYQTNNGKIDSYGVDHSGFTIRDELEYQFARDKREQDLMKQYNAQDITSNYPQYGTNFWGNSANNYGFGSSNISANIENMQNTTPLIPVATAIPQQQVPNNIQTQNTLANVYDIYKDKGVLGLGMQYAEPSVKTAMKAADWLSSMPISDVNKHQYVSCVGATGGSLAAVETLAGGIYKEYADYNKKMNDKDLLKKYGGKWGVISDGIKDLGNDITGAWKGYWADNPQACEELLPLQYRNKRYW